MAWWGNFAFLLASHEIQNSNAKTGVWQNLFSKRQRIFQLKTWVTLLTYCSCFILFPSVHTSLFMFNLISVSPHFIVHVSSHYLDIDHVSFLSPSAHSPSHSFHLPQSISFMFTLFGSIHITWSFNLTVSFTFQPIPLDKFLVLDRYSLLEAELWWFYYPFVSLYEIRNTTWCQKWDSNPCPHTWKPPTQWANY